jgi:pimeloyl-ACP methyl ester carboxylesterase
VLDASCGSRPVILAGHSIGGMTLRTFCRLFPELLGPKVAGLVLINTTYTMPLNTSWRAASCARSGGQSWCRYSI